MKMLRWFTLAAVSSLALAACSSRVEQGEEATQGEDELRTIGGIGGIGGGGGVFDPGPTYCTSVNTGCTLKPTSVRTPVHLDLLALGCTVPQLYSTGTSGYDGRMSVQTCTDSTAVRGVVAKYKESFWSPVYVGSNVCDKCLPRAASGKIYVFSVLGPGPNCGSGCRPPWG